MPFVRRNRTGADAAPATATQILNVAERLAQTRGFNGFSYGDIAAELGITKASLHYHFATKAELGRALIERYSTVFGEALSRIEHGDGDEADKLQRYIQIYGDVLSDGRMCLCGMLAAEYTTLPDPMKEAIRRFFDANETWLSKLLEAGRRSKKLDFQGAPADSARVLTAGLEGAMLLARSYGDAGRFRTAADHLLREFTPGVSA